MQNEPSAAGLDPDDAEFNFPDSWGIYPIALLRKVERALQDECTSMTALVAGAHHKIYRMTTKRGLVVIARVLSPYFRKYGAGVTPKDKIESEIATMRYVKMHTSIPVPEVLYHDRDLSGEVGGEWILLEEVPGKNLRDIWDGLSITQHQQAALAIVEIWIKLMSLRFDSIGSIRCVQNEQSAFCVGPMTFLPSDNSGIAEPPLQSGCGPFSSAKDWLLALARQQLSFISKKPRSLEETTWMAQVIEDVQGVSIPNMLSQPAISVNVLHHPDLGQHNIMVDPCDPTVITGVLDWEGSQIVPLWSLVPYFLPRNHLLTSPDELKELQSLMRNKFMKEVPEWRTLTKATCGLRKLVIRATYSNLKPSDVQEWAKISEDRFREDLGGCER